VFCSLRIGKSVKRLICTRSAEREDCNGAEESTPSGEDWKIEHEHMIEEHGHSLHQMEKGQGP